MNSRTRLPATVTAGHQEEEDHQDQDDFHLRYLVCSSRRMFETREPDTSRLPATVTVAAGHQDEEKHQDQEDFHWRYLRFFFSQGVTKRANLTPAD